jgi:hypothetical protein
VSRLTTTQLAAASPRRSVPSNAVRWLHSLGLLMTILVSACDRQSEPTAPMR